MTAPIAFYFDFISPFGYIGAHLIEDVAAKHGRTLDWRPMLLGVSVMNVMGLKPLPDTPLKGPYIAHDAKRFARMIGLPMDRPAEQMKPLPPARAFTWLKDRDDALAVRFAREVMRRYWAEARDMADPAELRDLALSLDIDGDALLAAIDSAEVKDRLRERVQQSLDAGVFGTPTFVVDDEMFWGADRVWMVDRWLETGGW
jgi:2-hydroxychromene-2-carboxylate isomerase